MAKIRYTTDKRKSEQNRIGFLLTVPVYIRKANYEKIRRRAEAAGKSIGKIINELIQRMD